MRTESWLLVCTLFAASCAPSSVEENGDAVTKIANSGVKDQGLTGNCWLYSTLSWAESLSAPSSVAGEAKVRSFSVAYLNYWQWYDSMTSSLGIDGSVAPQFGGDWSYAADLIERYGLLPYGSWGANEADVSLKAQAALEAAYAPGGALASPLARSDRALVRRELDKAFALSPDAAAALSEAFGADGSRDFAARGSKSSVSSHGLTITHPSDIQLHFYLPGPKRWLTLADAIGARDNALPRKLAYLRQRKGSYAWRYGIEGSVTSKPMTDAQTKTLTTRMLKAMNAGYPLPFSWWIGLSNRDDATGTFQGAIVNDAQMVGAHQSLAVDYEVRNVPGYGTLKAGVVATDAQKAAALSPQSLLSFVRIKNSWGTSDDRRISAVPTAARAGYNDLTQSYLYSPSATASAGAMRGMLDVVLPPGF